MKKNSVQDYSATREKHKDKNVKKLSSSCRKKKNIFFILKKKNINKTRKYKKLKIIKETQRVPERENKI